MESKELKRLKSMAKPKELKYNTPATQQVWMRLDKTAVKMLDAIAKENFVDRTTIIKIAVANFLKKEKEKSKEMLL